MSEGIQTIIFGSTHRLTAKPTVSVEMPLIAEVVRHSDHIAASAPLEADCVLVESLLIEMREVRACLEHTLQTLAEM